MKKILFASAAVLTLGVGAYSVYADGPDTVEEDYEFVEESDRGYRASSRAYAETADMTEDERDAWFDEMHRDRREYQEERIQSDLEAGRISEEEASQWLEDLAEDERYYEENGRYRRGHHDERKRNGYGHHGYSRGFNRNSRRNGAYCH